MEQLLRVRAEDGQFRPLLWVREDERWYLFASDPGAGWLTEVRRRGWIEADLPDGGPNRCDARLVDEPGEVERLRSSFRAKYGSDAWERHFGGGPTLVVLVPTMEVSSRTAVARARGEFDALAPRYHSRLLSRPTEVYVKERVRERLLALFAHSDPLLEIGPGSGFDTVALLAAGHHVTAVDLSEPMLDVVRERAEAAGVASLLTARVGRLARVGEALAGSPPGHFAGAFSTFGAFALEPEVGAVGRELGRLLRPGGKLALTTLNRPGAWPFLAELALGRPRAALQRLSSLRVVQGESFPLEVHPRRPAEWDRLLSPEFRRVSSVPVSVLMPPFNPERALLWLGSRGRRALGSIDRWLSERAALRSVGEWSLLVFERTPSEGGHLPSPG